MICLDLADDLDAVEESRALLLELKDSAQVLTGEKLQAFTIIPSALSAALASRTG